MISTRYESPEHMKKKDREAHGKLYIHAPLSGVMPAHQEILTRLTKAP